VDAVDVARHSAQGPRAQPISGMPGTPAAFVDGRVDGGSRQRAVLHLQRAVGNRATGQLALQGQLPLQRQPAGGAPSQWDLGPNPYAIESPGGGAKTDLLANPYAEENDPITLSNPRFTGEARLRRIAAGQGTLSSADNGSAVRAIQQALIDLGFEMVRHEKDGQFGAETREAIGLFRSRRGIPGDELSARALGELDRTAPQPGAREEHYYDFDALFKDGYLDVTIAIGYDEGGTHTDQLKSVHDWLSKKGFEQTGAEPGKPEQHKLRRDVNYPTRTGSRITREIIIRLNLIAPGTGAAEQFGKGLADSEIAIYNGHARRGIGPDFDEDKSPKENFIIGVGSALHAAGRAIEPSKVEQHHYVIDRVNDLEQMTQSGAFDKEKYRIWFFGACTSIAYFDELRGGILPASMDRSKLDLLGTRAPILKIAGVPSTIAMIEGVLNADTIESITDAMNRAGNEAVEAANVPEATKRELRKHTGRVVVHEGAGDNPIAPAAP